MPEESSYELFTPSYSIPTSRIMDPEDAVYR